ncbi:putative ribonuclease H-like domain-containing protein [Tanacetum coccineum]|uniref:Ribonuclease H-like domain-containing protein n=1 Tax=Tanacetum coccineum TaxID=301880 RepID=A0ABQ5J6K1_9ASTR
MTHPSPKRNMVPKAALMRSGLVSLITARLVNTAQTRTTVNSARPMTNIFNKAHSTFKRPINNKTTTKNSNFNKRVNTVSGKNVNNARPKAVVNTAKPKAVLNVVKGNQGNPQMDLQDQGVIGSGCSRHMTGNMSYLTDFEEINGGYIAFRVPRKNNMCSVDLKNIVPKGGLTCLFAKATSNKSKLWRRRLGHINFKTMNKLVKGNLVRGLPSKLFEINQTCVACQKGKQHRASCKSKTVSSISQPLHMLHMDLFGLTFVKSLMKKMYCLVVTDDYSRFSWVFFLATKDETSGILKSFITGVENLIDQRVKENRTLIKAARTMLADSKLPTTFWAEVANTTCYVQNRVLVTKPHNKTPYELFFGRKPALGFMRPFRCPVIILNTIDHLGKFDGKADEGFFVGYSINNKAFRVFNSRTRIVKENMHVQFSENTPNIVGSGPDWLFDIDALTKSMNYKPVIAGNQSNGNAGCDDAGKARMETIPGKDYILLPLWPVDPLLSQSSKISPDDGFKPLGDDEKKVTEEPGKKGSDSSKDSKSNNQEEEDNVNSTNTVNAASTNEVNDVGTKTSIKLLNDPNMPELEDIVYSDDDKDVVEEANMNNLDAFMPVSPIPTTRIHKDHPVEQIIRDLNSAPQTRRMTNNLEEHEGIDYDEVFALVARTEAIRLFLAYASFKDFVVYWMDVKSAFVYGKIEEEVYVYQPAGFEDPDFPDRRGKIDKTLFIRMDKVKQKEDEIFISQDKYVTEILKKFGFTDVKTASTPMETQKPLLKDKDGEEVDVHLYSEYAGASLIGEVPQTRVLSIFHVSARSRRRMLIQQHRLNMSCIKLGINLLQLGTVNAARHKLTDARESENGQWGTTVTTLVDGKKIVVTEASVRRDLHLDDDEIVLDLENIKIAQDQVITSLKKRVKKLEKKRGSRTHKLKRLYKGRKIDNIDADEDITLKNVHDAEMFDVNDLHGDAVFVVEEVVSAAEETVNAATITEDEITLAQALAELKSVKPMVTTATTITTKGKSSSRASVINRTTTTIPSKDKGKGIMVEEPLQMKKKDQISFDEQEAIRLQAEFDEELRIAREKDEANIVLTKEWNDIQAKIKTDYELAQRLQEKEQEEFIVDEKATLFQQLLEKRRKHFTAKRAE